MSELYGLGMQAYNTVAGMGMAQFNNMLARQQQQDYLGLNYKFNEMAAKNADIRTRRLYADFYSPEALMRMYEKAGLSPSMMFGGTPGQGGMSGAQGAGASGPMGATYGVSILEAAQAAALTAQAEKTKAETATIEGKNERGLAEIATQWAEANYKGVAAALAEEQKTSIEWDNYVKEGTADVNINMTYSLAENAANNAIKSSFEIINAQVSAEVADATKQAQIDQAVANVKYTDAQRLLALSGKELNEQKIQESKAIIDKWRQELQIEWKRVSIDLYNSRTERAKWKTMDEFQATQQQILSDRLHFDKDSWERHFTWTIVNDAFNSLQEAFNTAASVTGKPKKN